ncbi:MAG: 3-isopropylmalate/(R)-2-methylmalate dehydratase small subunit, partial [Paracoccaceae bacterium]
MAGWSLHTGMACALATENIDTDQLIPARFMST